MLLMRMQAGDWLVPLKFRVSKNRPLEAASYPVWSVPHSGSCGRRHSSPFMHLGELGS